MNFILERVTQPEIEPITLAEAKRHIKQFANVTSEDSDYLMMVQAAREWVENYTGRALIDQEWRLTVSPDQRIPPNSLYPVAGPAPVTPICGQTAWVRGGILLRRSPILELLSLTTVADDGTETVVDASAYQLREPSSRYPSVLPTTGATWGSGTFRIQYRAGFADRLGSPVTGAEVVPATLKHAIKLILASLDENRSPIIVGTISSKIPMGVEWLVAGEKCDFGGMS